MKITLITRYFKHTLNIRVANDVAEKIIKSNRFILDLINEDIDRVAYGYEPRYLSVAQVKKIRAYNRESGDYFYDAEIC